VQSPLIMQLNPTMIPIMVASADIDNMTQIEISDYVDNTVVPYLESVEGVASVTAVGSVEETIQITLDEDKIDKINKDVIEKIEEKFVDAQDELDDAKKKIEDGEKAMKDGQNQMAAQISDGANQIVNGKIQAYVGESQITTTLTMMTTIKPYLEKAVSAMNAYNKAAEQQRKAQETLARYEYLLANATDEEILAQTGMTRPMLEQVVAQMKASMPQTPSTADIAMTMMQLRAAGIDPATLGITADPNDPNSLSKQLTQALAQVNSTIVTMEAAKGPIAEGKATLDDAYKQLNEGLIKGILEMSKAASELANGKAALEQGQAQLDATKE